jgi:hypothetical protein
MFLTKLLSRKQEFREIQHSENHIVWESKWIYTRNFHIFLKDTGAFGTEYLHLIPYSNNEFRENTPLSGK